jgi:hypothetical protein
MQKSYMPNNKSSEIKSVPQYVPKPLWLELLRTFFVCIPVFIIVYSLAISACTLKELHDWTKR